MYSTRTYLYENQQYKLRPDGELQFPDGRSFLIEIDKGTESYSQLLDKFKNYQRYLAQLDVDNYPAAIIFITDPKEQTYGLKRRWTYMLAAYLTAMGEQHAYKTNLILTPLNQLTETLDLEIHKSQYNKFAIEYLKKIHNEKEDVKFINVKNSFLKHSTFYLITVSNDSYLITFTKVVHEFESSLFSNFLYFLNTSNKLSNHEVLKNLKYIGFKQALFTVNNQLYLPKEFPINKLPANIETKLKLLHDQLEIIPLHKEDVLIEYN